MIDVVVDANVLVAAFRSENAGSMRSTDHLYLDGVQLPTLRSYFENADQQRRALDAVAREGWLDPGGNRFLYEASQRAFDPSSNADEAFRAFEEIYNELKGPNWQVFRSNKKNVDYWKSRQVFDAIKLEFPGFSWRGSVNLLNFPQSGTGLRMESGLANMRSIKPNKHYPLMTVSKFLHFYNPGLFPIYDGAVIWKKVFSRFRDDFRGFCLAANIPYEIAMKDDTGKFLHYYALWANSLLSAAHGSFMQVFVEWLDKDPGTGLPERMFDPATLYATAFEFTVIGAAADSQVTRGELSTRTPGKAEQFWKLELADGRVVGWGDRKYAEAEYDGQALIAAGYPVVLVWFAGRAQKEAGKKWPVAKARLHRVPSLKEAGAKLAVEFGLTA